MIDPKKRKIKHKQKKNKLRNLSNFLILRWEWIKLEKIGQIEANLQLNNMNNNYNNKHKRNKSKIQLKTLKLLNLKNLLNKINKKNKQNNNKSI